METIVRMETFHSYNVNINEKLLIVKNDTHCTSGTSRLVLWKRNCCFGNTGTMATVVNDEQREYEWGTTRKTAAFIAELDLIRRCHWFFLSQIVIKYRSVIFLNQRTFQQFFSHWRYSLSCWKWSYLEPDCLTNWFIS